MATVTTKPTERKRTAEQVAADNAERESIRADIEVSVASAIGIDPHSREVERAEAQRVLDAIAGGKSSPAVVVNGVERAPAGELAGFKPTRKQVRAAIKTVQRLERERIAELRGIEPEERVTFSNGLSAHISNLKQCAEQYFDREEIDF